MTVRVRVDGTDPTPPYEQLRAQLAQLISGGAVEPGSRLPPVRQLAADLGLATGTVARAYRELEAAGLVRTRRGGGTTVSAEAPVLPPVERKARIDSLLCEAVYQARRLGASEPEIAAAFERARLVER